MNFTPEFAPVAVSRTESSPSENRELLASIAQMVRAWYVDPITADKEVAMARGAVKGMMEALSDPRSQFLNPADKKLLDDATAGKFHGIGAVVALRSEKLDGMQTEKIVVVAPMPGSSAEAAGLRPGDCITHMGGKWIINYSPLETPELKKAEKDVLNKDITDEDFKKILKSISDKFDNGVSVNIADALQMLTSIDKGEVNLTVQRAGQSEPIEFAKVSLAALQVAPVVSKMIGHGMEYFRISQFNDSAAAQFSARIDSALKSQNRLRGIVLDLRDNPGGQMESAKRIASKLTGGGLFATIQERSTRAFIRSPKVHGLNLPVVVLINGGTANVAEILAGDLQENIDAALVGTRTFGDGLAQTPLVLKDGSEAVVTTGKMLTSQGHDFNSKGLDPTRLVPEDKHQNDAQLSEAEKILLAKLGRA
jgi:carboxyl-terminal processing protease